MKTAVLSAWWQGIGQQRARSSGACQGLWWEGSTSGFLWLVSVGNGARIREAGSSCPLLEWTGCCRHWAGAEVVWLCVQPPSPRTPPLPLAPPRPGKQIPKSFSLNVVPPGAAFLVASETFPAAAVRPQESLSSHLESGLLNSLQHTGLSPQQRAISP